MQEIHSSNPSVVTGICDPNNPWAWHHCRINMFVGCFEIRISVIVNKHVQSIGMIRVFCLLGGLVKIFSAWKNRRNCWVVVCPRGSVPRLTLCTNLVQFVPLYHVIMNNVHVWSFTCTISNFHGRAPKTVLRARNLVYEKL